MRFPGVGLRALSDLLPSPTFIQVASGLFPRKGQPGKWRFIVNLSSPGGASVNDGINTHEFTFHYITVDQIIRMVSRLGRGALMAKFDVEAAYRNIPVRPSDRFLLGMKWQGSYYVDLTLPSGLRSAPYIFNSAADMVEWILVHSYEVSDLLHYLDDFITARPPASIQCARNLSTALAVCDQLGLPLHPGKCVGPAPVLTVLGIELDSVNQVAHLPEEKLHALRELIASWLARSWCNRRARVPNWSPPSCHESGMAWSHLLTSHD